MNRSLTRRASVALLLGACALGRARADAAARPLRLVIPFPAGGTADILPRIVGEKLRARYPAGVLVENRTGAGGNIGAEAVYRSEPDGHTLLVSPPGPIAINHHLYRNLGFDPTRWVPVSVIATVPNVLAVRAGLPAADVAEFVAYLKAHPGQVSYASQGNGSTSHLTACLLMQLTGTQMVHIPYKGTAPALVDLVGGQVDVFFDNLSSSAPFHQSQRLRILAVADAERSPALPQVPTFAQAGLERMNAVTFFTMVAPPGTPAATVEALQAAVAQVLEQPDVRQRFADQGAAPRGWPPAQTAAFIRTESQRWREVIRSASVTLE